MSFWCITTFFNPANYQSLTGNYHVFKQSLHKQNINLLTLELSFGDDEHKLPEADDIVHLRGNSVMWHKERLINYGASILPDSCTSYGWLDCDLVFSDDDWANKAAAKLEYNDVIQLFKRVYYLPRGDSSYQGRQLMMLSGISYQRSQHGDWLGQREDKQIPFAAPGFAWAARRETFQDIGIYDRDIVGSGDCVLVDTLLESWQLHGYNIKFNDFTKEDIEKWRQKVKKKNLSVDYLPVDVFHLWHGSFKNRQYMRRHDIMLKNDYDPKADIVLKNNVFEWSTDKTQMHQEARQYFYGRQEDSYG